VASAADWVFSIVLILGAAASAAFCLAGIAHGVWVFAQTLWPQFRRRPVRRGFEVLPAAPRQPAGRHAARAETIPRQGEVTAPVRAAHAAPVPAIRIVGGQKSPSASNNNWRA
jgi:hypothetical protein